jgi:glycosyltransferase involved in cell wall biosynthesis
VVDGAAGEIAVTRARCGIFLPVRNGAAYIREAIQSVIDQTSGDWLLVVLDNASTDGTAEMVAGFRHPQIRVQTSEVSLSIWESWHRIWTLLSQGAVDVELATIIGHDDRLLPAFVETVDRLVSEHPKASLYQTPFDMIDERGNVIRPCRPIPSKESSSDFLAARMWGLRDSVGTGYVFRPADYVAVGGIPNLPDLLYADDLLFARLANLQFKVSSRESQCLYRLHRGSASHRMTPERIEGQVAAIEEYVTLLQQEFPDLMNTRAGNAALACFLAREIMIMRPLAKRLLLHSDTCLRIGRLERTYSAAAKGIPYQQWLGSNAITRSIYPLSKQAMLFLVLMRGRFGAGSLKAR